MLVHDASHKAEIYKYLWLLMTESDPNSFHALMEGFLEVWDESEPKFAEYFREYYTNRVGELHITLFEQLLICRYNRKVGYGF